MRTIAQPDHSYDARPVRVCYCGRRVQGRCHALSALSCPFSRAPLTPAPLYGCVVAQPDRDPGVE